jgi:hypothetical protein
MERSVREAARAGISWRRCQLSARLRLATELLTQLKQIHARCYGGRMRVRARKLIGMIVLLVFLLAYAMAASSIGASRMASAPALVKLVYFLAAGLAWVFPAGLLIRWMQRPDTQEELKRR